MHSIDLSFITNTNSRRRRFEPWGRSKDAVKWNYLKPLYETNCFRSCQYDLKKNENQTSSDDSNGQVEAKSVYMTLTHEHQSTHSLSYCVKSVRLEIVNLLTVKPLGWYISLKWSRNTII